MLDFISTYNPVGQHHIGYFGVTPEDIRQTVLMLNLRYDRSFRLALNGEHQVGVMGVDIDKEIGRAWLYGPLVTADDWAVTADTLYEEVQKAIPREIIEHEMFVDAQNVNCLAFAERFGFLRYKDMSIYYITPDRVASLPEADADEWDDRFADQLVALHDRLFPRSNYTLAYMLAEREKGAQLLTLSDGTRLSGYFFGRAEPESGEAYVDLVGVDESFRRSGAGRRLMLAGLARLRRMPGLRQINLTVATENESARRLYDSLGFVKERDMNSFRKRLREGEA
jgi:ribosomal protein S18 acetylase RimI-like enzyme